MNPDGTDQRQITDFGAMSWAPYMHPSGQYFLFASNKLGFENFELFMVDIDGDERAGARHLLRWLRRAARAVAGRQAARVDVDARRRSRGADLPAQWNHEKALEALPQRRRRKPSDEDHERPSFRCAASLCAGRGLRSYSSRAARAGAVSGRPRTRAHVETLASERFEGRDGGLARRTARRRLHRRAAHAHGREAAARAAATVRCRSSSPPARGRRVDADRSTGSGGTSQACSDATSQALSFSDDGEVERRRSSSPATASSCRKRRTSATTATQTLDVKDKIVLVLRYFPEDADAEDQAASSRAIRIFATRRWRRGSTARKRCSSSPARARRMPARLMPMTFDTALAGSGILAASISGEVADALFAARPKTLADAQKELDSRQSARRRLPLPDVDGDGARHGRSREADRPQRRGLSSGDQRRPPRAESRGSPSARTTITSATARAATRSRRRTRPGRVTAAPTTTPRARRRCSPIADSARRRSRAAATCCSRSGRARSSA